MIISDKESLSIILFTALISSNVYEFLSTLFLNVPEEGEILVKSSFERLLVKKKGIVAIKIVSFTSIITYSLFLIIGLFLGKQIIFLFNITKKYSWILLFVIILHILIKEKNIKKGLFILLLSGALGIYTFNVIKTEPFLPLLTGMFGISSLIKNSKNDKEIPTQMQNVVIESSFFELLIQSIIGIISSIIMALVPSISPSQVGLIAGEIKKGKNNDEKKVATITSINISDNLLSLISMKMIFKGRSGVIEKIGEIISLTNQNYYLLLFSGFFTVIISSIIIIYLASFFAKKLYIFESKILKIIIVIFVTILTHYLIGLIGILILVWSTIIGVICQKLDVSRTQLLGSLSIPTLLFYFKIYF